MSKQNVDKTSKTSVPTWQIDPFINKEESKYPEKDYVALPNAAIKYEFKENPGARTYIEIKLDKSDTVGKAEEYYKELKEKKIDFSLKVSSESDNITFFKNRIGSEKYGKEVIIKAKDFYEPVKYMDEYSGPKGKSKNGDRIRIYLEAKGLEEKDGSTVKESDIKVKDISFKLEFVDKGSNLDSTVVSNTVKIDAESVDVLMSKKLLQKIENPKKFPPIGKFKETLGSKQVMGSFACIHKCGEKSFSNAHSNASKKFISDAWKLILQLENPEKISNQLENENVEFKKSIKEVERNGKDMTLRTFYINEHVKISDIKNEYLSLIDRALQDKNTSKVKNLHKLLKNIVIERLESYLKLDKIEEDPVVGSSIPVYSDGPPGFHAEVFAVNEILHTHLNTTDIANFNRITEITQLLLKRKILNGNVYEKGDNYPACGNCTAILSGLVRTPTGTRYDKKA